MSLSHRRIEMRLDKDLTTNGRLLGQEQGAQAVKSQQGDDSSQIHVSTTT